MKQDDSASPHRGLQLVGESDGLWRQTNVALLQDVEISVNAWMLWPMARETN